jgi:ATPase family associated with various cellular activities (AAA)
MAMQLNLNQTADAIATIGMSNTLILRGEPGVGKSSVLRTLSQKFPEYHAAYIDCANLDLGDVAMPVVDKAAMVTNYAPNARFGVTRGSDTPVIIMLDELGKASRSVLNMLLPTILEHRIGDAHLPAGSMVFATTNLDTDGVGDNIPAHAYNRMTEVIITKPTPKEWIQWASDNDVDPIVLACAKQYPEFFDSYVDMKAEAKNPYIFNPLTGNTRNFVSPRSLEKASNVIKARAVLGTSVLPLLAGTVGEPAARMIEAITNLSEQVPDYDAIVKNPSAVRVPDSVGALFLLAFLMAGRLQKEDVDAVCTYNERLAQTSFEAAALFVTSVASNNSKVGFATKSREFTKQMVAYGKYF